MSSGNSSNALSTDTLPPRIQLYQGIIFGTPVLFASILLFLFCLLYTRRQRSASLRTQIRGQQFIIDGFMDSPTAIAGLTKSFREMLPIINFDVKFASTTNQTQCTVCLGDYQLGEKLLQLPTCGHSFHVECIDEWLSKHVTCPICRTSLLLDEAGNGECSVVIDATVRRRDEGLTTDDSRRMWEERVTNQIQEHEYLPRRTGVSSNSNPSSSTQTGNGYTPRGAEVLERS